MSRVVKWLERTGWKRPVLRQPITLDTLAVLATRQTSRQRIATMTPAELTKQEVRNGITLTGTDNIFYGNSIAIDANAFRNAHLAGLGLEQSRLFIGGTGNQG